LVEGEEIAVRLLRFQDEGDERAHAGFERRVGPGRVNTRGRVQPAVCIRIREEISLSEPFRCPCGQSEILETARALQLLPLLKDGDPGVAGQPLMPEWIGEGDGRSGQGLHPGILTPPLRRSAAPPPVSAPTLG